MRMCECMYVCVYKKYVYVFAFVCVCVCLYVSVWVCVCVIVSVFIPVILCKCLCPCMSVFSCVFRNTSALVYDINSFLWVHINYLFDWLSLSSCFVGVFDCIIVCVLVFVHDFTFVFMCVKVCVFVRFWVCVCVYILGLFIYISTQIVAHVCLLLSWLVAYLSN